MSRRILITGGAGFIGSHLARHFAPQAEVTVLDDLRSGFARNLEGVACRFLRGSILDDAALPAAIAGAEEVYHLAAMISVPESVAKPAECAELNTEGTRRVLAAAAAAGVRKVVLASSAAIYGNLGDAVAHEGLPPAPLTAYGADKLGSELHAAVGWQVHRVPALGLRFFNVFGPRQDPHSPYSGVISIFAALAAADRPITVHGDGRQVRDFVYVGDVVAHLRAADLEQHLEAEDLDPARCRARAAADEGQQEDQDKRERAPEIPVCGRIAGRRQHRSDGEGGVPERITGRSPLRHHQPDRDGESEAGEDAQIRA